MQIRQTDKQTYRHDDRNTTYPYRGEVIIFDSPMSCDLYHVYSICNVYTRYNVPALFRPSFALLSNCSYSNR